MDKGEVCITSYETGRNYACTYGVRIKPYECNQKQTIEK